MRFSINLGVKKLRFPMKRKNLPSYSIKTVSLSPISILNFKS